MDSGGVGSGGGGGKVSLEAFPDMKPENTDRKCTAIQSTPILLVKGALNFLLNIQNGAGI